MPSPRSWRTGPAGWRDCGLQRLGGPPRGRLLPLADHGTLRRPARARCSAQRHPARGLADDAVLLPRDHEAVRLHRQEARPAGQGDPTGGAVSRRLSVRQGAAVVRARLRGASGGDARARGGRRQVRDRDEPHDLLRRNRRPGVHAGLRVRGAGRLHAPDADARETEASKWTQQDTPIFVGALSPIRSVLAALDGAAVHASAG